MLQGIKISSIQNYMPWKENASTAASFVINGKDKNSSKQLRKKFQQPYFSIKNHYFFFILEY